MINWLAIVLFVLLTGFAGAKLVLLWRETRKLPELLIAVLILGVGTLSVGVGFVIRTVLPEGPLREAMLFVPLIGANVGMAALCIFTWKVYRPTSQVARAAATGLILGMAALTCIAVLRGSTSALDTKLLSVLVSSIHVGIMAWSAAEAIVYWSAMRKRLRIGLAEPLVTNRVLLWGIATGTSGLGIAIGAIARHWAGIADFEQSWVTLCYAGHGLVSATAFWLAFKPPAAYVRWIQSSARTVERGATA